ncbi:MAG: transposase [Flavobacteriaceae bacterium]|nr:transposase [Flavobacteriaceae bacterium]
MKELFNDVFALSISEYDIHYLLNRFVEKSRLTYQNIKKRIASSTVIGANDTGIKVNGCKHWFWTWKTNKITYIMHSHSVNNRFET